MHKKLFSAFLVASALVLFSGSAAQALATNHPSWHWVSQEVSPNVYIDVPVDDRCDDPNPGFKATVFVDHNFSGARARLCGYWDDLSQLPQYKGAPSTKTFSNSISSIWVKDLPEGPYFTQFYFQKDQEGDYILLSTTKYDIGSIDDNKISSVKRVYFGE